MISNNDSSLFSLLLRKSIIDPRAILKTCHRNCMYKSEKSFHEVSTQCQDSPNTCADEQTQVSQSNESKDTQTSDVYSPIAIQNHRRVPNKYTFINPYAIIDRVNQGEEFLQFLQKQNSKLNLIYTNFLKNLQKYTDHFLRSLQQEHCLYGIYRRDMIRYMIILQDHINNLQTKLNILQESNKNFALFQKHFHKIIQSKSPLENLLNKHEKHFKEVFYQKEPVKYQQQFFEIYQKSYIQLRAIEQQRLLAIREQMRCAINLTVLSTEQNLFTSNNFDDLLNTWEDQNLVSIDHWSRFPHRSIRTEHDLSLILLDEIKQMIDEYYHHEQINSSSNKHLTLNRISHRLKTIDHSNEEFLQRMDSITSNITQSHI